MSGHDGRMRGSRAKQITPVTKALLYDMGTSVVPYPPIDWFVRGPRGGVYEATGARTRRTNYAPANPRQMGYVTDLSDGVRYLRPRTRRHAMASAILDGLPNGLRDGP